jgi:hypothetical protein
VVEGRDGSARQRAHPEDPLQKKRGLTRSRRHNQYICSARTSAK